jgi:hypothetical protein
VTAKPATATAPTTKRRRTIINDQYNEDDNASWTDTTNYQYNNNNKHDETFVGTNQNLEKPYLRLTTFPRKEDVRPLSVLRQSLAHVKARYKQQQQEQQQATLDSSSDLFVWTHEQLKSIRQDITVQAIRNHPFVLEVYETHARILLEHGDLNEFNQCQTMIHSLMEGNGSCDSGSAMDGDGSDSVTPTALHNHDDHHSKRRKKKNHNKNQHQQYQQHCNQQPLKQSDKCADEFGAYALLYALVNRSWMSLKMEYMRIRRRHIQQQQQQPSSSLPYSNNCKNNNTMTACQHAMCVIQAVLENNYHQFFTLYNTAPNLSGYLMDFLVKRVRDMAYQSIMAAFRPTVTLNGLQSWLGFWDHREVVAFLKEHKAVMIVVNNGGSTTKTSMDEQNKAGMKVVDCKASMNAFCTK